MGKKVSICLPTYKNHEMLIEEFLPTLHSTTKSIEKEIVIVDNSFDNIGYSRGCNLTFRRAKGDYILLTQDDVTFTKDGWLDEMISAAEKNPKSIITADELPTGYGTLTATWCILFHKDFLQEVGDFDERFKFYCEDVDLMIRAKLLGWKIIFIRDLGVKHKGQVGSSKAYNDLKEIQVKSNEFLAEKWGDRCGEITAI